MKEYDRYSLVCPVCFAEHDHATKRSVAKKEASIRAQVKALYLRWFGKRGAK